MVISMKYLKKFKLEDTYEINTWFLKTITEMLIVFKKHNKGYPARFHKEYYDIHKNELEGVDEFIFTSTSGDSLNDYLKIKKEEMKQYSINKWNSILDKMIYLFTEAKCDSLALKTDYQRKCAQEGLELFKEYFEDLWW